MGHTYETGGCEALGAQDLVFMAFWVRSGLYAWGSLIQSVGVKSLWFQISEPGALNPTPC